MEIQISIRQIGKKKKAVEALPITLHAHPQTLRGLLCELARTCAEGYNARMTAGESGVRPMTEEELHARETVGKLAFGVVYGDKRADPDRAAANVVQAFEDGLIRVFQGEDEVCALDAPIDLERGDAWTFVRLTMLSGSSW